MSDYTKLSRDIADCMSRAGSPLSEDQELLLAGYLAPVQEDLAKAKEENERVRQANIHTMDVFEDMKAAKEKAEARVAELASKAHNLSFGIVNSLTDEQQEPFAKQFAELQDCISAQSSEAYVLRKQAEALESVVGECEGFDQVWDRAQDLRQQADEAERAGGEQ